MRYDIIDYLFDKDMQFKPDYVVYQSGQKLKKPTWVLAGVQDHKSWQSTIYQYYNAYNHNGEELIGNHSNGAIPNVVHIRYKSHVELCWRGHYIDAIQFDMDDVPKINTITIHNQRFTWKTKWEHLIQPFSSEFFNDPIFKIAWLSKMKSENIDIDDFLDDHCLTNEPDEAPHQRFYDRSR